MPAGSHQHLDPPRASTAWVSVRSPWHIAYLKSNPYYSKLHAGSAPVEPVFPMRPIRSNSGAKDRDSIFRCVSNHHDSDRKAACPFRQAQVRAGKQTSLRARRQAPLANNHQCRTPCIFVLTDLLRASTTPAIWSASILHFADPVAVCEAVAAFLAKSGYIELSLSLDRMAPMGHAEKRPPPTF